GGLTLGGCFLVGRCSRLALPMTALRVMSHESAIIEADSVAHRLTSSAVRQPGHRLCSCPFPFACSTICATVFAAVPAGRHRRALALFPARLFLQIGIADCLLRKPEQAHQHAQTERAQRLVDREIIPPGKAPDVAPVRYRGGVDAEFLLEPLITTEHIDDGSRRR